MKPFKCPKCKRTTSRDKDFCVGCGATLTIVCDGCGERWRYYQGYRFCPSCGGAVGKSAESHSPSR
jgi:rRNA maturation endonuclease Nob1